MPAAVTDLEQVLSASAVSAAEDDAQPLKWFVLWTHSHYEQLVVDQLSARGFELFLPRIDVWSRRAGARHLIRVPMFPGYVFLHDELTKVRYTEVRRARGLVTVLGTDAEGPAPVTDAEVGAIQRIVSGRVPVVMHPYLTAGQRVRITSGPMTDVEGILVRTKPNKGLVVLSVDLLRRSVAVEVDCTIIAPAAAQAPYA